MEESSSITLRIRSSRKTSAFQPSLSHPQNHLHHHQQQLRKLPCNSPQVRSRREGHLHPAHDGLFSEWKVLVGSTDWQDHAAQKMGSQRYRLYNLPTSYFGPGVYELGLCWIQNMGYGYKPQRRIEKEKVVAVYVGQAENIRSRLQQYGRSGSHLEARTIMPCVVDFPPSEKLLSSSTKQTRIISAKTAIDLSSSMNSTKVSAQGSRLFTDAFSHGYSVAFRWTAVASKMEAERLEAELLKKFDYGWNIGGNRERRAHDIYAKLKVCVDMASREGMLTGLKRWKWLLLGRRRVSLAFTEKHQGHDSMSRTKSTSRKFSRFLLARTCLGYSKSVFEEEDYFKNDENAPGILSRYDDNNEKGIFTASDAKNNLEVESSELTLQESASPWSNLPSTICGFMVAEGIVCTTPPGKGRKRCSVHKGLRLHVASGENKDFSRQPKSQVCLDIDNALKKNERISSSICGIPLGNGSKCNSTLLPGRKRCESHKGMRIKSGG